MKKIVFISTLIWFLGAFSYHYECTKADVQCYDFRHNFGISLDDKNENVPCYIWLSHEDKKFIEKQVHQLGEKTKITQKIIQQYYNSAIQYKNPNSSMFAELLSVTVQWYRSKDGHYRPTLRDLKSFFVK